MRLLLETHRIDAPLQSVVSLLCTLKIRFQQFGLEHLVLDIPGLLLLIFILASGSSTFL